MKKTSKTILICVLCAVLVLGGVLALIFVPKLSVPHAKEYAAQFDAARADFDAAVELLGRLTKKDPAAPVTLSIPTMGEDHTIYFFRDNKNERVVTVAIKPEERARLDAVARAFAACGTEFKNAHIEDGNVTFTAADDAWRVLYVVSDEKPETPQGMKIKKLDTGWYQMIKTEK